MSAQMINKHNNSQWREFNLVLKTHVAEYLKKPLLNLGFILSLAIATSTLLCILVLNHASQQQYQDANSRLKSPVAFNIVAKAGHFIKLTDFSRLKALGFHQLTAVHVFRKKFASGKEINFRAMDILPLVITMPEAFSSQSINISKKYANSLGLQHTSAVTSKVSAADISLADQGSVPVNYNTVNDWGKVAIIDLALAWQLFPDIQGFSHLMVGSMPESEIKRLAASLPEHLSIQESWSLEEREGFADALHLNLSALAILGFIVSLFIAFQAANQAWSKRSELAAQLRLLGVELGSIQKVMLCEAFVLTLTASFIGIIIAVALVSILLPILGLTLDQLYQLRLSGHFQWTWQYSAWAFSISAVAVIIALVKQFRTISSAHIALSARTVNKSFNYKTSFLLSSLLLLAFILWPEVSSENNWHMLMIKYGVLLIASVALLPNLLRYLLIGLAYFSRSFRLKFVFKDASQQVGRRYLPLAAFYLALTSSIAAALMVNSFESAFVGYLKQLLNSDLFISYNQEQKPKVVSWLKKQTNVEEYVLFQQTAAKYDQDTVAVHALHSAKQQQSLLLKAETNKEPVYTAESSVKVHTCFINEQLALNKQLNLTEKFTIKQGNSVTSCWVKGIYFDYGNQGFAIKIPMNAEEKLLSGWKELGFGVIFTGDTKMTKEAVIEVLKLDDEQVFEPEQIKQLALGIFKQTFILTQAIAFVLLSIACFGLFLSANSLELARKADLHILSSLGYNRLQVFTHMLLQWLLLALGVILLSWPVAVVLANALVTKILPVSFGWSMPLVLNIDSFAVSSLIGLLILLPALAIPLYKLNVRASLS